MFGHVSHLNYALITFLCFVRLDYNYFLSIPLNTDSVIEEYQAFKDAVLSRKTAGVDGIDSSIFVPGRHLHLTVAMLKLYSDERRHLAVQALDDAWKKIQVFFPDKGLEVRRHKPSSCISPTYALGPVPMAVLYWFTCLVSWL